MEGGIAESQVAGIELSTQLARRRARHSPDHGTVHEPHGLRPLHADAARGALALLERAHPGGGSLDGVRAQRHSAPTGHDLGWRGCGLALPALFEKYALRSHGKAFKELTAAERSAICVKIAERAGVTNANVNLTSRLAPKLGKTLVAVTIAIAIYQVASQRPKTESAKASSKAPDSWVSWRERSSALLRARRFAAPAPPRVR